MVQVIVVATEAFKNFITLNIWPTVPMVQCMDYAQLVGDLPIIVEFQASNHYSEHLCVCVIF